MAYLVLARKYRPTTFAEVIGQEHVTRTLANAFSSGRVHHAFLFCGPRGCGKTTLARIVGRALNCERGATSEPCGVCLACKSINDGSAVDYIEMDGASNRGIDAIRELTEAVRYQPAVLRKKVYVIDEVHMLTTEAFNALLKTLEEPPAHVTFVLATTEPHKLPNTILSRCQRYDFKLVPASRLAQHLTNIFAREQLTVAAGAVGLVVRESGGSVRDALSLADQVISYVGDAPIEEAQVAEVLGVADRSLTRTIVAALAGGEAGQALAACDTAIARGVDEVQIARAVVRYLRDLAVLQVAPERRELVDAPQDEWETLRAEASRIERTRVTQMFDRMLRCCDELGKTLQPRLVLDCALIDVATLEPLIPLGDLLARLGELETRARGGGGGGQVPRKHDASPSAPAKPAAREVSSVAPATPTVVVVPPVQARPAVVAPSGPVPTIEKTAAGSGRHAIPTNANDVLKEWEHVLSKLSGRNVTISGAYEPARVLAWTAERLELGFPAQFEANKDLAEAKEKLEALAGVLLEEYGHSPKISIKSVDDAAPAARSVLEASRERSTAERSKREAEAREHPITKHVLQTFGAQIKEIKTDV